MRGLRKSIATVMLSVFVSQSVFSLPVLAGKTESTVTFDMCNAAYWNALYGEAGKQVLMSTEQIERYNAVAMQTEDCNMNDLLHMDDAYDAAALKEELADSTIREMPQKDIYVNGGRMDTQACYTYLAECILASGWDGERRPGYALCVSQTQIRSIPASDYIGYSEVDTDDEAVLSSLRVNEPFVIKQCAMVNGRVYYFGYSDNVSGWVDAMDLAICSSREEWLDLWKVDLKSRDHLVVITDEFHLSQSYYSPATSEVKLTMGTVLKLVPEKELPENIAGRGLWNNYAVYIPVRGADGSCVRQIALIGQNREVSIGYLPMTSENIITIAFEYLGDIYGWGGMLDSVDCSALVRNVYKCFGLDMPRNTNWQRFVPGAGVDISGLDEAQKAEAITGCVPGMPLYMSGHTMLYLGTVNGVNYVISALGSVADSGADAEVKVQNTVAVTPLTVRRRNGSTWLANLTTAVLPWQL